MEHLTGPRLGDLAKSTLRTLTPTPALLSLHLYVIHMHLYTCTPEPAFHMYIKNLYFSSGGPSPQAAPLCLLPLLQAVAVRPELLGAPSHCSAGCPEQGPPGHCALHLQWGGQACQLLFSVIQCSVQVSIDQECLPSFLAAAESLRIRGLTGVAS